MQINARALAKLRMRWPCYHVAQ